MDPRVKIIYNALLNKHDIQINYRFKDVKFADEIEFAKWVIDTLKKEQIKDMSTISVIDLSGGPREVWAGKTPLQFKPPIFNLKM